MSLLMKSFKHHVEQCWFCRLIRRVEDPKQTVAPIYSRARRVDAMLPIIVSIAVTLTTSLWSRIACELPQRKQKCSRGCDATLLASNILPPLQCRTSKAEL